MVMRVPVPYTDKNGVPYINKKGGYTYNAYPWASSYKDYRRYYEMRRGFREITKKERDNV